MADAVAPRSSTIAQMRVEELIGTIGEKGLAAGAGVAGAITLALAAACAAKAAAVSLEHRPDNDTLRRSQQVLERIGRFAVAGADRDAESFATFIKENTLGSVVELLREGGRIFRLIDILAATLEKVAPQVEPALAGDLVAARALMEAARQIQRTNCAQAEAEKTKLTGAH